jgi:hypothetical protein
MLCNDRDVLGPWTNGPVLQVFASIIVGVLVLLSVVLTVTTLFPSINVTDLFLVGAGVLAVALVALGFVTWWGRRGAEHVTVLDAGPPVPREQWTMPPATLLSRPQFSLARRAAMLTLGGYMVVALVMLIVKSVQLAGG